MHISHSIQAYVRFSARPAVIVALALQMGSIAAVAGDQIKLGRELFLHKWVANDPLSPEGDGLGPMHNADSCVARHHLGGTGGAGPANSNVEILSVAAAGGDLTDSQKSTIRANAAKIHPALFSSTVLHRFSTAPDYERWRLAVLGFKLPADRQSKKAAVVMRAVHRKQTNQPPVADLPRQKGVPLQLIQRNTTALFGAGLIDSISEKTLTELARTQAERFPGIHGRVAHTADGKVGRFGWRGQVSTLREFVLTACAMELGLQNADHLQARDPLHPDSKLLGNDLTSEQCDALVAFIVSLPAPEQLPPLDQRHANALNNGEQLFETIGCAGCHVRDIGQVAGIFSDLLLHDMGPELEDPLPAMPERIKVGTVSMGSTGYGGGGVMDIFAEAQTSVRREWKTAPLWGVRDSAPYLHDGRARTLEEAIVTHGGEAESSASRFRQLGAPERSNVLTFLQSLAGPPQR